MNKTCPFCKRSIDEDGVPNSGVAAEEEDDDEDAISLGITDSHSTDNASQGLLNSDEQQASTNTSTAPVEGNNNNPLSLREFDGRRILGNDYDNDLAMALALSLSQNEGI